MSDWVIDGALGLLLLLLALAVLHAPRLYTSVVLFIGFGLLTALTWARLGAVDLALAEAAIGAGLTGVLLFGALRHTSDPASPSFSLPYQLLAAALPLAAFGLLVAALWPIDQSQQPLPAMVAEHLAASGVEHPVTAVLLNFRGWDTLLELVVVLIALLGVRQLQLASMRPAEPWPLLLAWSRWLAPLAFMMGAYLLWRGASAPGGAFQAGALWAAAAVILRLNGLLPAFSWQHWPLRLLAIVGVSVFLLLAALTAWLGDGWLSLPAPWAKTLIITVELAATISIASALALLVAGQTRELAP